MLIMDKQFGDFNLMRKEDAEKFLKTFPTPADLEKQGIPAFAHDFAKRVIA